MFRSLWSSLKAFAVNHGSLSDTIESGSPKHLKRLSLSSLAIVWWFEVFVVSTSITPFVSPRSTMDSIESIFHPSLSVYSGRSVIKSIAQSANGLSEVAPSSSISVGLAGRLSILYDWHMVHPLT